MKSNRLLILCCLLALIAFANNRLFSVKKTVVNMTSGEIVSEETKDLEIIDSTNYIRLLSDTIDIENLFWIDNDNIYFEKVGEDIKKLNPYILNLTERKLTATNKKLNIHGNAEEINNLKIIERIKDEEYLGYKKIGQSKSLVYISNNDTKEIINNINENKNILYKISGNREKIAVYDLKNKKIKIYNFLNNEFIDLDQEVTNYILENYNESISFSANAGYLIISNIDKELSKSYFSVFGADSGKVYGEKILGLKPVWNNDSLSIAYIYNGNSTRVYNYGSNNQEVIGKLIGVYNLRTRNIKYTQPMASNVSISTPIIWGDDDSTLYFKIGEYSTSEKTFNIKEISAFNISQSALYNIENSLDEYKGKEVQIDTEDNLLVIKGFTPLDSEDNFIRFIDLKNRKYKIIHNMQLFTLYYQDKKINTYFKGLGNKQTIYISNNSLYFNNLDTEEIIYKIQGEILGLYLSPNRNEILIASKIDEDIELAIIDLMKYINAKKDKEVTNG